MRLASTGFFGAGGNPIGGHYKQERRRNAPPAPASWGITKRWQATALQRKRTLLGFGGSGGGSGCFEFLYALDAGSFAAQSAQVAQLGATHAALAYHFD